MSETHLDHRGLIRALSPEQRIALTRKSDWRGLAHLALHAGTILLLGALILARVPGWPLLMIAQGILIVFLFTLLHETSHRTAFETIWINKVVAALCGFLIALPPEWFRNFHFEHHRHTQNPEKDPELATPQPSSLVGYALHVSGLPVWRSHIRTLLRNAVGRCADSFVPRSARDQVRSEAQVMLLAYAGLAVLSVALSSTALLFVWVLPALLGQPFLRLYLMAEHGRCPAVANMFENSRTTFTNWLTRKIAWNMPYHAEHHAFPAVPFFRLPEWHALTRAHLQVTETGYARFHTKVIAALSRKANA